MGSRHARSKGSRQALGAMSWWIDFGPQEPCSYRRTADGIVPGRVERLFGANSLLGPNKIESLQRLMLNQQLLGLERNEFVTFQSSWPMIPEL